jgi:7-cyano-7-deazaguanine synthase
VAERPLSVVLLSGGMDSLVTTAIAARDTEPAVLHASYGQRTEGRERRAFREIADHYRIHRRLEAPFPALAAIGGSALTDPAIPVRTDGAVGPGVPASYVPFRNGQLLSLAAAWAEVLGAVSIYIGAVEEDSSGYPDCREVFFRAFEEAIGTGTKRGGSLRIVTPVIHKTKAEIVRLGLDLGAPFHLSWSCYVRSETACGVCDSCRLRLGAFRACGVRDPIPYTTPTAGRA